MSGPGTLSKWDGSEHVPLRGEKGSLWEGGMKVPMWVHWQGHIPAGQVISQAVSTLDFTATALKLAGGEIPPEFDGVDILPYLTKQSRELTRTKDLFWDWGDGIALQRDDWKIHRFGRRLALFNIKDDPNEFFDLQKQQPEKFKSMEAALMERYNSLPDDGKSPLRNVAEASGQLVYVNGAADGTPADPRYLYPYQDGKPVAYPAPLLPKQTNLSPEQTKTIAERKGQAPVTRKAKAKQREKEKEKTANPSK